MPGYNTYCCAKAFSQNERALGRTVMRAQCGLGTLHTLLMNFEKLTRCQARALNHYPLFEWPWVKLLRFKSTLIPNPIVPWEPYLWRF